jgi:two-component system cell cycle response regulator
MDKDAPIAPDLRTDALPSIPLALGRARAPSGEALRAPEAEKFALADQSLAALILRVANSPLYGRGGAVSSVEAALKHLGPGVVRRMAVGLSTRGAAGGDGALDRPLHLEHSVAAAAASRTLARLTGAARPEDAHAAGLLHSVGAAWFAHGNGRKYAEVLRRSREESLPLDAVEREVLGMDHGRAGALLAERWNLPVALRDAILHHHAAAEVVQALPDASRGLVEVVAAADAVLAAAGMAICCRNGREAPSVAGKALAEADAGEALASARGALQDVAALLGLPAGERSLSERIREAESAGAPAPPGATVPALPARPSLKDAAAAILESERGIRGLATADEAWEEALRGLRLALGAERTLFFAYDAEMARLDLRHGNDDTGHIRPGDKPLAEFSVAPGGGLAHALRDGLPVLLDEYGADIEFLRGLGASRVAVAPVDILEKTHGILVVDNVFSGRPLDAEDVAMLGLLANSIGLGITNLHLNKQAQKLRALAERDELTGVNNRRNLMTLFKKEIDRSRRHGANLSVAMVDIDYFKSFNDTYGHQAGDDVLRVIAQVLVSASRDIDVVGRYGGEEFVVLLPETTIEQAIVYADRLRARVELRGQDLRTRFNKTRPLTISLGVTQAEPKAGDDVERIIERADEALYEAKEAGRNRVIVKRISEAS